MSRLLLSTILVVMSMVVVPSQCDAGVGSLLRAAARKGWKAVSETVETGLKRVRPVKAASTAVRTASHGVVQTVPGSVGRHLLVAGGKEMASTGSSASGVILSRLGLNAVGAVNKLSPTATARVAEMSSDLALSPHRAEWLRLLREFGDEAADFLWQNKGAVAVAATTTAVVLSPNDFLEATGRMAETVVETTGSRVLQPIVTGAIDHVAVPVVREATARFPWTVFFNTVMILVIAGGMWRFRRRK
ncbi:MAG: hypothetical protein R3C59_11000 [Planctomycetaceae bacterium]